jgi:hypothetical protein
MCDCIHEPGLNYQAIFKLKRRQYYVCKNCGEALAASNWAIVEVLRYTASVLGYLFYIIILRLFDHVLGDTTLLGFIGICLIGLIAAYIVTVIITILLFRIHLAYTRAYYKKAGNM